MLTSNIFDVNGRLMHARFLASLDPFFRVLCVDDDSALQRLMKLGLRQYGFEVVTAAHAIDAMRQYKANGGRFGTIISDHNLPDLNGVELVRKLRHGGYEGRVVVMSNRLTASDLQDYAKCAISGIFSKPFDIGLLATMISQGG